MVRRLLLLPFVIELSSFALVFRRITNNNKNNNSTKTMMKLWFSTTTTTTAAMAMTARSILKCPPPVIGILAHPYRWNERKEPYYIAASYSKWLECGGARTIAIPWDASPAVLDELFTQIHMIFLPGGDLEYSTVAPTLNYLLDKVCDHNRPEGAYFPVWGTCLGFQQIVRYVAGKGADESVVTWDYQTNGMSATLEEVKAHEVYQNPTLRQLVTTQACTFHTNSGGICPDTFRNHADLSAAFHITSVNRDKKGQYYVSTIEPKYPDQFPFYGIQYHPEKNPFEYGTIFQPGHGREIFYQDIDRSPLGIQFSFLLAQFVGQLARKSAWINPHHEYTQTQKFPPLFTYPMESQAPKFQQIHLIPPGSAFLQQ